MNISLQHKPDYHCKMLNIACGSRYHNDWINIDIRAESSDVIKTNILSGLPFNDNYFDVVYTSHFIEHLSYSQVDFVLNEIYRILDNNGIVRIVVPDLEDVCREYLKILELTASKKIDSRFYEYIVNELLDQLVRTESGGNLGKIYNQERFFCDELKNYIEGRVGNVFFETKAVKSRITIDRIRTFFLYNYLHMVGLLIPKNLRSQIMNQVTIGELHKWMYDRYSLPQLLQKCNFKDIKAVPYNISNIPNFNKYCLDADENGTPYKGNSSLYIEAIK